MPWVATHIAILIAVVFFTLWLGTLAWTFNQERQPFAPYVPKSNAITLPTIGITINGTQVLIEPDISISITLKYQGTLVAGQQSPVNLSAIAFSHVPSQNVSQIFVQFQGALDSPNIPAQD